MAITDKQLRVLQVGRRKLGLAEDDYRGILIVYAGVDSAKQLTPEGFNAVMERFRRLGFVSDGRKRTFGDRPGMATPGQVAVIRNLWRDFTSGEGTDRSLDHWIENRFKVTSLRFLDFDTARKVLGALKIMTTRQRRKAPPAAAPQEPAA